MNWSSRESERTSKAYCCAAIPRRTRAYLFTLHKCRNEWDPCIFRSSELRKILRLPLNRPVVWTKPGSCPYGTAHPLHPGNAANYLQQVNTGHFPNCGSFKSFQHHWLASDLIMWSDWLRQSSFSRHHGRVDVIMCMITSFSRADFRIYKTSSWEKG